jgi:hypothetical protein
MVFRPSNPAYSARLLKRAAMVNEIDSYFICTLFLNYWLNILDH